MTLVIDRIEEGTAVCEREDGTFIRMPAPDGAREGDLLVRTADGWRVDEFNLPGYDGWRYEEHPAG